MKSQNIEQPCKPKMRVIFQIVLLILYLAATDSSIYTSVKRPISEYLKNSFQNIKDTLNPGQNVVDVVGPRKGLRFQVKHNEIPSLSNYIRKIVDEISGHVKEEKPKDMRIFKTKKYVSYYPRSNRVVKRPTRLLVSDNMISEDQTKNNSYHLGPDVLNNIRRNQNYRRRAISDTSDSENSESSSLDMKDWKTEYKELWLKKKIEALNQSEPLGDVVNMVAARPWGAACGDPNQHDMPWGTCMMAMECEPEYRIYRGDFQCGRTTFVCCSLQISNYDMNQGFDVSFEDSALTTDEDEQRNRGKGSREKKRKRKQQDRKRRRKARLKRKKKIKNNIKKIIREIRKILKKQYRNGTSERKRKTKVLKKFVKDLKKRYKQDRKSVKNIHEINLVKIDSKLYNKLNEIRELNENFVTNATFRDIIVNGTLDKRGARMLVEAYPDLLPYFTDTTRRRAVAVDSAGNLLKEHYMDYDVEYGMLYY